MLVNLGIIGCGRHAVHHAEHLNSSVFTVVSVFDTNPEQMQKIKSIRKAATLEELLADTDIEAVMICSLDEHHLTQIEMALRAGKHVFCEKPLLDSGEDLSRLEAAFDFAEKHKLVLTSCHPRRYDRPFLWLLDRVSPRRDHPGFPERFGKVIGFDYDFSYHTPSNTWKHGRSLLLDHLNHEVDLMNCLFGIQGFNAWKLADSFDHYAVAGKRDDDIIFSLRGTRRLKKGIYPEWCRVRFDRGEVELDMMMGLAYIRDDDNEAVETIPKLTIDHEGRLTKVMNDFGDCQIVWEQTGYLSRSEMLMNTEAGIVLQNEGIQRINIRK